MLFQRCFEIKVAFIGLKNSGKSTLINALLQDKYAPDGIGGSTVCVNSFRIFNEASRFPISKVKIDDKNNGGKSMVSPTTSAFLAENSQSVLSAIPDDFRNAQETFKMISDQKSMQPSSNAIQEFAFDVKLQESLCDMQHDTILVLIDIPGIKSNDSECKYLSYLRSKSDTFDCIVFVLDVLQCLEEQSSLLKLLKVSLAAQSIQVPIIVACNKVDDPNNHEVVPILSKVQAIVEEEHLTSCKCILGKNVRFNMT
jgi:GTPase SAR1 family protein